MTTTTTTTELPVLKRVPAKRLREIYRSAGWPFQNVVEIELLAAGLMERVNANGGLEALRVTDTGIQFLAESTKANRKAFSSHEALVLQVAKTMRHDGRLVWTALELRAWVRPEGDSAGYWKLCKPDVFSIRSSSKQNYLELIVHEIKVSRVDLLGDLKRLSKRAYYLDVAGQCW
jgi:hypothetical protein